MGKHRTQEFLISITSQGGDDNLVFSQYDGKPFLLDSITHAWKSLANRIGLKGVRLHDARHTHASLMLKQGVHPKVVQERLGHATISTTLDLYSHVTPGLQQAAAEGFDKMLSANHEDDAVKKFGQLFVSFLGKVPWKVLTKVTFQLKKWSQRMDSNHRPAVYETAALPLSYAGI